MKILIVHPFGIGDVIFSFALTHALKKFRPGCRIDYLLNERTAALAELNAEISNVHIFNRSHLRQLAVKRKFRFLKEFFGLLGRIRKERYDVVFDLSLGKEYAFFLMCLGIPERIGFDYRRRGLFLTRRTKLVGFEGKSVRDFYLSLIWHVAPGVTDRAVYPEITMPDRLKVEGKTWLEAKLPFPDKTFAVVAPGGGISWGENRYYKQWPAERFAQLARMIHDSTGLAVLVMGDHEERGLCLDVAARSGLKHIRCVTGEDFQIILYLLSRSRFFVGNDGGLVHLADLLGVPLVGIYGPVDDRVYGPIPKHETRVLAMDVPCRPCYQRFKFPPCSYDKRCLRELTAQRVMDSVMEVLREAAACQK